MDIDIYENDNEIVNICNSYWEIETDDKFKYKLSEIAKEFNKSTYEIRLPI